AAPIRLRDGRPIEATCASWLTMPRTMRRPPTRASPPPRRCMRPSGAQARTWRCLPAGKMVSAPGERAYQRRRGPGSRCSISHYPQEGAHDTHGGTCERPDARGGNDGKTDEETDETDETDAAARDST